jgi:alpha/beta superfamily hydrolase
MAFPLPRNAELIRFMATDGVSLEGRWTPADPRRAVVLCHPHPLYGGSMLTPVILTVEQAFQGVGYSTLAFNFRGVGASEGTHGDGRAERADVEGALAFVRASVGGVPPTLAVAGYSFGSVVGGQVAAAEPRVGAYLGIALPLARDDFAFLRTARCRIALIVGGRDEFGDPARLAALAASLPAPPWVRTLAADHFFTGMLGPLAEACREAIAAAVTAR